MSADDMVYDRRTIRLHWLTAAVVTFQWVVGRLNGFLPKGPLRLDIWSIHVLVGFALVVLVLWRMGWRLGGGRKLPPAQHGARHALAFSAHVLLYILLVGVVGLGVLNTFAHGFPLFGVWKFPMVGPPHYSRVVSPWHDLFANLIMALAAVHALAALAHRFVLKDRVLQRMWPSSKENV
jgi:cytochrome b561